MAPYRTAGEPEAEVLYSARIGKSGFLRLLGLQRCRDELRVERVGMGHRVRILGTDIDVRAPFELRGSSEIEDGRGRYGHYFMRLEIRGANGASLSISAHAISTTPPSPPRREWFAGEPMRSGVGLGDWLVPLPEDLWKLRDALLRSEATAPP